MTRVFSCTLTYSRAQGHWHPVWFVLWFGNELETPASCSSSSDTELKQFSRDLLRKHEAAVIRDWLLFFFFLLHNLLVIIPNQLSQVGWGQ